VKWRRGCVIDAFFAIPYPPGMPRKQKPPGMENWTWSEINLGRRMSKGEKRMRRMAKAFGATEGQDGKIVPPKGKEKPLYYVVFMGLLLLAIGMIVFAPKGCQHYEKMHR
jgi:hypothetical protein